MNTHNTNPPHTPSTQIYTVQSQNFSQAPLSADLHHLDEVAAAHASNGFEHLVDLIIARAVVPLSPFDHVVVINHALTTVQVRVVDGSERGRTGWIPSAWLHSAPTAVITGAVFTGDETIFTTHAA